LKRLGDRDDGAHVIWIAPVNEVSSKYLLVFARCLIA
jgi:hypothetical protein